MENNKIENSSSAVAKKSFRGKFDLNVAEGETVNKSLIKFYKSNNQAPPSRPLNLTIPRAVKKVRPKQ